MSAALCLARKGYSARIISDSIGTKTCGGGFTQKALERWPWILKNRDEFDGRVLDGVRCFYREDSLLLRERMACVHKQDFDTFLRARALEAGVRFHKAHVKGIEEGKVVTSKGSIPATVVFDATGALGPVLPVKKERALAVQRVFKMDEKIIDKQWPLLYGFFELNAVKGIGYSWIFPDRTHVKVGTGIFSAGHAAARIDDELDYLIARYAPSLERKPYRKEGAFISVPTTEIDPCPRPGYFIGGDAAGLANSLGEGNYYALLSAELFASTLDADAYRAGVRRLQRSLRTQYDTFRTASRLGLLGGLIRAGSALGKEKWLYDLFSASSFPKDECRVLKTL